MAYILLKNATRIPAGAKTAPLLAAQDETVATVVGTLTTAFDRESDASYFRAKLVFCTAQIAGTLVPLRKWPDCLTFLVETASGAGGAHVHARASALETLGVIATDLRQHLIPHLPQLHTTVKAGLEAGRSGEAGASLVSFAALSATAQLIRLVPAGANGRAEFQALLPLMLDVLRTALEGQHDSASSILDLFVELMDSDAAFLVPALVDVTTAMVTIAEASSLDDDARRLAMEFMLTLVQRRSTSAKKSPLADLIHRAMRVCLMWLVEGVDTEDDEDWERGNANTNTICEDENFGLAQEALDLFSLKLGSKVLLPQVYTFIGEMLASNDWRAKHAGLIAMSVTAEGVAVALKRQLPQLNEWIVAGARDAHPRVRFAAANAIGQFYTDFADRLQTREHCDVLVPALLSLLEDSSRRVVAHAASAVINVCDGIEEWVIKPYAERLLATLSSVLQRSVPGDLAVAEAVLSAIASVATACGESFVHFYEQFATPIKTLLSTPQLFGERSRLRARAIEAMSLLLRSIPQELARNDALAFMADLVQIDVASLPEDDEMRAYLHATTSRLANVLSVEDYRPFLPQVLTQMMHHALQEPEVRVEDKDELNASGPPSSTGTLVQGEGDDEGWHFIEQGGKRVGINTAALEEKATACGMVGRLVSACGAGFYPFYKETLEAFFSLMDFDLQESVRFEALFTISCILKSVALASRNTEAGPAVTSRDEAVTVLAAYVTKIFSTIQELDSEDLEARVLLLDGIRDAVDAVSEGLDETLAMLSHSGVSREPPAPLFTSEQLEALTSLVQHECQLFAEIEAGLSGAVAAQHMDAEEAEQDLEESRVVLQSATEIVTALFKSNGPRYVRYYAASLHKEIVGTFSRPGEHPFKRHAAMCLLDDLVEYGGDEANVFVDQFFGVAIAAAESDDLSLRQAAVFGLGLAATKGGASFAPAVPKVMPLLAQLIADDPDREDPELANVTENAVSAVGRIALSVGVDALGPEMYGGVLSTFLRGLPMRVDTGEGVLVARTLGALACEAPMSFLVGESGSALPGLLQVMADPINTEFCNDEAAEQLGKGAVRLATAVGQQAWEAAIATVEEPQRSALLQAMGKTTGA